LSPHAPAADSARCAIAWRAIAAPRGDPSWPTQGPRAIRYLIASRLAAAAQHIALPARGPALLGMADADRDSLLRRHVLHLRVAVWG
jgi:hypothetical protein